MGFCCVGWGHLVAGEISEATTCFQKAVKVSTDPWYSVFPKLALCYGYISNGRMREAEQLIEEINDESLLPDFSGRTMREVLKEGRALGLKVELEGTGLADEQSPRPGAPLKGITTVRVRFRPPM